MNLPIIDRVKANYLMDQSELALITEQFNTLLSSHKRLSDEVVNLRQTLGSYVGFTQKLTEEITEYKRNKRAR